VFVEENVRSIAGNELISKLDDELYALNSRLGEGTFPKQAKAYLDDWSASDVGWLRKYYPPDSDEAHYDATPAVEKAYAWVTGLREREFVGTESRLNTVFDLLRQIVFGTETDPEARLVELRRRRLEIDTEIAAVEAGDLPILEPAAQRDRYQQFASTAWSLLADFREVERVCGVRGGLAGVVGGVPAVFEMVEESLFEFGGDVAVGFGDAVVQVVAQAAGLGDFGVPSEISQVLWLCRSPWKVNPGRTGTVRTGGSARSWLPSTAGRRIRRMNVERHSQVPLGVVNT
jgi:hypothetical protein